MFLPIPCADWWRIGVGRMWGLAREDVDWSVSVERRGGGNFARRLDASEVLGCGRLGCLIHILSNNCISRLVDWAEGVEFGVVQPQLATHNTRPEVPFDFVGPERGHAPSWGGLFWGWGHHLVSWRGCCFTWPQRHSDEGSGVRSCGGTSTQKGSPFLAILAGYVPGGGSMKSYQSFVAVSLKADWCQGQTCLETDASQLWAKFKIEAVNAGFF